MQLLMWLNGVRKKCESTLEIWCRVKKKSAQEVQIASPFSHSNIPDIF